MKSLKNYSENEAAQIIEEVVNIVAPKYSFGYYDEEDIAQEARILSMRAINEGIYDEGRPLRNFLFVYLKSRLLNLRRDKYFRKTVPCTSCPLYDPKCIHSTNMCSGFLDKMECDRYNLWYNLNTSKKNLMDPIDIDEIDMENEDYMYEQSYAAETQESNELSAYIDIKLPISMRQDYLKLLSNYGVRRSQKAKLSPTRVREIQGTVSGIIEEYYGRT